jgi:hypothetical protein
MRDGTAVHATLVATQNPYEVDLWKDRSSYRGFCVFLLHHKDLGVSHRPDIGNYIP